MHINETVSEQLLHEKNAKLKKSTNRFLVTFLAIFFFGYLLFFTSKLWLPSSYNDVTVSPIGQEIEVQNRNICIDKWAYDPESREMEIILEIENLSSDGIYDYAFSLFDRGQGKQKIHLAVKTDDFLVLRATLSRRWSELSLRINAKDETSELETMKFYTTKASVQTTNHLKVKTAEDYRIEICDIRIRKMHELIAEKEAEIKELTKTMSHAQEAAEKLIKKSELKTEQAREDALLAAEKLMQERASAQNRTEMLVSDIKELKKQMQKQEAFKERRGGEK